MSQDSDSDYEEEVTPVPEEVLQQRQSKKDTFRAKLLNWKSKRIDEITRENQDQTVLNKYLKEAADLYKAIREKVEGRAEFTGGAAIPDFDLNTLSGIVKLKLSISLLKVGEIS